MANGFVSKHVLRFAAAALMALGLAAPSFAANPAYPHREIPPVGASGDDAFNDVCKDGGFMIGFKVYLGSWFDHIQMICSDYFPDGTWRPRTVKGGYGGNGGYPDPKVGQCGDGWVLEGISLTFTQGNRQVSRLWGQCRNMATGSRSGPGSAFSINPADRDAVVSELAEPKLNCRSNEAAAGFSGRYGKHVNALGLNCRKFPPEFKVGPSPSKVQPEKPKNEVVGMLFCRGGGMPSDIGLGNNSLFVSFKRAKQSSTAAIPGPGECAFQDRPVRSDEPTDLYVRLGADGQSIVQTGKNGGLFLVSVTRVDQGFWAKTIHSVDPNWVPPANGKGIAKSFSAEPKAEGGKKAKATREPEAEAATFTGRWNAEADGTDYAMTMEQNGANVSGTFKGRDGSKGTLSGKVKNNVLRFSWKQKDGVKGTGTFALDDDGSAFQGTFAIEDDDNEGSWSGTRD